MAGDDSFYRYVTVHLVERHERARLCRSAITESEVTERQQATENRSCGAKTRAGHPCRHSRIDYLKPTGRAGLPGRPDLCASSADSANSAKGFRSISNLNAIGTIGAFGSSLDERAARSFGYFGPAASGSSRPRRHWLRWDRNETWAPPQLQRVLVLQQINFANRHRLTW